MPMISSLPSPISSSTNWGNWANELGHHRAKEIPCIRTLGTEPCASRAPGQNVCKAMAFVAYLTLYLKVETHMINIDKDW